ncbi:MAG: hypothetical protein QM811_08170 [Pirellulales bacterium]
MAYSLKTETLETRKGKENDGAWLGFAPKNAPFNVKETTNAEEKAAAATHLAAALKAYAQAVELDPNDLKIQLGYAWCLDQSGIKNDAIAEYRKAIEMAWEKEKDMKRAGLGWHSVVVEAAEYLKPLLDPEKQKAEIAALDEKTAQLNRVARPITPIAVPLRAGLTAVDIVDDAARVAFDADGTGVKKTWSWITPDAAWLVTDHRGDGKPDSGLRLFGNVSFCCFWENGYHALRALDDDRDGRLSGRELHGLALWRDLNANGVADAGEVRSLSEHGVTALSCDYRIDETHPDRMPYASRGVTFENGEARPTYDVILHPRD